MNEGLSQHDAIEAPPACADEVLLARFARSRDEEAFAELVGRHAALVLGVCRRVLGDAHDADDAFQATFLVLAGRARGIRRGAALAAWLYGVAFRTARRLAQRRKRQATEPLTEEMSAVLDPLTELTARHDRHIVDEELNRLPRRYRDPLVLFYLEGKSRQAVAEALGDTITAIDGRIKRGKRKLRMRLVARGVSVGGVLTAIALARAAEQASSALVVETVQAGLAWAGGITTAGVGSALARQLATEEVSRMTLIATAKIAAGAAAVCAAALLGAGGLGLLNAQHAAAGSPPVIRISDPAASGEEGVAPLRVAQAKDAAKTDREKDVAAIARPAAEQGKRETLDYKRLSPNEQRITDQLDTDTFLEFIEVPLEDAVEYLKDLHNIHIELNEKELKSVGVRTDAPITRNLKRISLRDGLRLLLRDIGCDFILRNNVLEITSEGGASRYLETRVYETRHLRGMPAEMLVEAIQNTIRPGQWDEPASSVGSDAAEQPAPPRGAITLVGDALVVTHSQRVHEEVVDLLEQLARLPEAPPNGGR